MFVMFAPFLIFFVLFTVLPIFSSLALSFTSYDLIASPVFNGIDNYKRLIVNDMTFAVTVKNTLVFAIVAGPLGFLLSFILAWAVNEFSPGARAFMSLMFYAPSLVGNAYFIWKVAFTGDSYGYINSMLLSLGIITEPVTWLKNEAYLMPIIIVVQLWQSMGVSFLANISGLQNVNRDLYEAGAIDGVRNRWQELRYITLPSMSHMLLFSAVMQIQASFSVSAIAVTLAGYPSKGNAVDTVVSLMSDVATVRYEFGYASAIAVVLFTMMVITRLIVGKSLEYGAEMKVRKMSLKKYLKGRANAHEKPASRRFTRSRFGNFMNFFLIFLAGLFTMLPLVYAVCTSFKPLDELMIFPPRFFVSRPTLENYLVLPELMASLKIPLSRYIFNSIFVSVVTSLCIYFVSAMAAFVLSKATFYGRNVLFWIVQFALMFSATTLAVPQYLIFSELRMINIPTGYTFCRLWQERSECSLLSSISRGICPRRCLRRRRLTERSSYRIFSQSYCR